MGPSKLVIPSSNFQISFRSSSTLVSHWAYEMTINGKEGWHEEFLKEIGLPEVTTNNFQKIGNATIK